MIHAKLLDIKIDTNQLKTNLLVPHQSYEKLQKYAKNHKSLPIAPSTYEIKNEGDFIEQLPSVFLKKETPKVSFLEMIGADCEDSALSPHIDIRRRSCINFYLKTSNEITYFYDWNKTTENLTEIESFISKDNEAWLLNVTIPHSVSLKRNTKRHVLTFSFLKTKFEEFEL
jgi:hypothetical protein